MLIFTKKYILKINFVLFFCGEFAKNQFSKLKIFSSLLDDI